MIYICIPTHNEQQTVGVVLWKLRQVFADFPRDYQLLVGDDASTDKTADVLEPYARVLPLTVIRTEQRQGYAATVEMLLREAVRRSEYPKRDVIITLQADFSEEPDDLVPLLKRMEAGADVAVGNKIGKSKPPRMRRMSIALAAFFLRKMKLPEGVATPFESYRAYRLYSIKRAVEDRDGKRLIRYDGWAAHAELLRAVLPHARRVDVVDVVDRTDRLQRARREQPFAAAMQVRAMAAGREPQGLIGVEELDRIAATASRTRERGTVASMAEYAQRAPAGNGGRTRQRTRQESSRRGTAEPKRPGRQTAATPEEPRRPTRQRAAAGEESRPKRAGAGEERGRARGQRRTREERERTPKAAPRAEPAAELEAVAGVVPAADEAAATKPKKRRRRRRKSSGAGPAQGGAAPEIAGEAEELPESAGAEEPEGEGGVTTEGEAVAGERKRRRRGGRRGGRGRKRGARTEAAGEGSAEGGVADGVDNTPAPPPESAPIRSDNE